jgi:hypothetical protein
MYVNTSIPPFFLELSLTYFVCGEDILYTLFVNEIP